MNHLEKWNATMLQLQSMKPPVPFNPDYDPRWEDISDEAHRRTRKVIPAKSSPTMQEQNEYQSLYSKNYNKVRDEMDSGLQSKQS